MTIDSSVPTRRPARQGLFGGLVSSKQPRAATPPSEAKKAPLKPRTVLNDAVELVKARKGRLLVGFLLMAVNRAAGLVLPGTTKFLLDDVIGKGNRGLLPLLVLVAGGATLVQAVTSFALSQVLGKAAQRSITEMRRAVQRHVGAAPVSYFEQTKAGSLLSRVMTDAEGIRNLVGTGLVEVVGRRDDRRPGARHPLLFQRQADVDRDRRAVALRLRPAVRLQTLRPLFRERSKINAEVSGRLDRVVLRRAGGQGLPRRAARGAGVLQGRPPPLPQRRQRR